MIKTIQNLITSYAVSPMGYNVMFLAAGYVIKHYQTPLANSVTKMVKYIASLRIVSVLPPGP